jgi:hypothetical protein
MGANAKSLCQSASNYWWSMVRRASIRPPLNQATFVEKRGAFVRAGHPDHHRRRVGHIPETFLAFPHRGFGTFTLAYVHVYADHADGIAPRISEHLALAVQRVNSAIRPNNPELSAEMVGALDDTTQFLAHPDSVLGINQF